MNKRRGQDDITGELSGCPSFEEGGSRQPPLLARSFPGLDLLRLAAALMVAFYHFAYFRPAHDRTLPLHAWAASGWCGVEIFFVISGFVIAFSASRKNAGQFLISRAARLYPAAWICATITILVVPASPAIYLRSLALFPLGPWVSGVYWTLAVEISFYALICLSLWRGWSLHWIALLLGGFSTLCWALRSSGFALPVGPFGHYGCYFAFGMLLFERRSLICAILFFVAGAVGVHWMAADLGQGYAAPIVWCSATMICVALVFSNERTVELTRSWPTRTLGLMTYPLYLIHDTVGPLVLRHGITAALAVSLLAAFGILPFERAIRSRILSLSAGRPKELMSQLL
jgi:peptidoglycan/LPS O-acetylase OafA/YrhL